MNCLPGLTNLTAHWLLWNFLTNKILAPEPPNLGFTTWIVRAWLEAVALHAPSTISEATFWTTFLGPRLCRKLGLLLLLPNLCSQLALLAVVHIRASRWTFIRTRLPKDRAGFKHDWCCSGRCGGRGCFANGVLPGTMVSPATFNGIPFPTIRVMAALVSCELATILGARLLIELRAWQRLACLLLSFPTRPPTGFRRTSALVFVVLTWLIYAPELLIPLAMCRTSALRCKTGATLGHTRTALDFTTIFWTLLR